MLSNCENEHDLEFGSLTHRLAVRDDLSVELVHGHEGRGVRVEVDEAVGGRLARELVLDHLDGEHVLLAHHPQAVHQELLVHVRLQLERKELMMN